MCSAAARPAERETLDAVEVPVEDPRGRSIRGGYGAHEPLPRSVECSPLLLAVVRSAGGGRIVWKFSAGKRWLTVKLAARWSDGARGSTLRVSASGAARAAPFKHLGQSQRSSRERGQDRIDSGSNVKRRGRARREEARLWARTQRSSSFGSNASVFWQPGSLAPGPRASCIRTIGRRQ